MNAISNRKCKIPIAKHIAHTWTKSLKSVIFRTGLDNLQSLNSLSNSTLRKIIEASGDDKKFQEMLTQLKFEMGEDYLDLIKAKLPPNEIVIAIEHQGEA